MQLEQSGFRIYRAVLSRTPSLCLIVLALTCLVTVIINSLLMS